MKKEALKMVANVVKEIAIRAASSTSLVGYHQPVEPESVRRQQKNADRQNLPRKWQRKM